MKLNRRLERLQRHEQQRREVVAYPAQHHQHDLQHQQQDKGREVHAGDGRDQALEGPQERAGQAVEQRRQRRMRIDPGKYRGYEDDADEQKYEEAHQLEHGYGEDNGDGYPGVATERETLKPEGNGQIAAVQD